MPKLRVVGVGGDGVCIPATAGVLLELTRSPAGAGAVVASGRCDESAEEAPVEEA